MVAREYICYRLRMDRAGREATPVVDGQAGGQGHISPEKETVKLCIGGVSLSPMEAPPPR